MRYKSGANTDVRKERVISLITCIRGHTRPCSPRYTCSLLKADGRIYFFFKATIVVVESGECCCTIICRRHPRRIVRCQPFPRDIHHTESQQQEHSSHSTSLPRNTVWRTINDIWETHKTQTSSSIEANVTSSNLSHKQIPLLIRWYTHIRLFPGGMFHECIDHTSLDMDSILSMRTNIDRQSVGIQTLNLERQRVYVVPFMYNCTSQVDKEL